MRKAVVLLSKSLKGTPLSEILEMTFDVFEDWLVSAGEVDSEIAEAVAKAGKR